MYVIADLHLHSRFSRAVSPQMTLPVMAEVAVTKGIHLISTSDWTHPIWMKEIQTQLEEKAEGIYGLKMGEDNAKEISFVLSTEISSIYKQGDKLRRIHNLVFAPSFAVAEKITQELVQRGANVNADGRPIIGLSSRDLLEIILSVDEKVMLIPCHVWTPHFGLFGSASGFDSIEEAFGDLASFIYGVETGLSSDPEMNWNIPELKSRSIVSFSDAHSPAKMGREATALDVEELTYSNLVAAIHTQDKKHGKNRVVYTVEFYPEEGKYHFSGHRNCKVSLGPDEVRSGGDSCPVCHKTLTEGVFIRLQYLAQTTALQKAEAKANTSGLMWYTDASSHRPPFVKCVPLLEIAAEAQGSTVLSQKTRLLYNKLIHALGGEIDILLKKSLSEISSVGGEKIAQAIAKVRKGDIYIQPGYDGEYGVVKIWGEEKPTVETSTEASQLTLDLM